MIHADKLFHFAAGGLACLVGVALVSPQFGVLSALLLGAAKEAYDATGKGTPDGQDFIATAVGGLAVAALL